MATNHARNIPKVGLLLLAFFLVACRFASANKMTESQTDTLQMLKTEFSESIRNYRDDKNSIEFCPDSTCDLFVRKKHVSDRSIGNFIYLYLYFFSDYYSLEAWREKSSVKARVQSILDEKEYGKCRSSLALESARCIARYESRSSQVEMFSVRYDERHRRVERKSIDRLIR